MRQTGPQLTAIDKWQHYFFATIYPTLSYNSQNGHCKKQLFLKNTHTDHLNILIPKCDSPKSASDHGIRCQFTLVLSREGHCQHHQSNTPYPYPICWHASQPAQLPNNLHTRSSSSRNGESSPTHANYPFQILESGNLKIWHGCPPNLATIWQRKIWEKHVWHNFGSHTVHFLLLSLLFFPTFSPFLSSRTHG